MADLTYVGFHCFVEDAFEGVHNLGANTLKIALSNTAPVASTDDEFADITEIAAGSGYTAGGEILAVTSSTQTGGAYSLVITSDVEWVASGGAIATFRYLVLYNDSATNKELIGYWDIGSATDIAEGNNFIADLDAKTLISLAQV